jgi:ATP-dependent exoDNAse (exonuclease V) alpha subunit
MLLYLTSAIYVFRKFYPLIEITPEYEAVLAAIARKDPFVFISGRAGTGKTTLVNYLRNEIQEQVAVVAPTGVAALQVRGMTIHSFFRFPPRLIFPEDDIKKLKDRRLYNKLGVLIIDEISMVRADMIDAIDMFLRVNGPREGRPFGGVQVIFVGDLFQLPPVVRQEEMEVLRERGYEAAYFFNAQILHRTEMTCIELQKIFRQKDKAFTDLLNQVRMNQGVESALQIINDCCYRPLNGGGDNQAITLTTTNQRADSINSKEMRLLDTETRIYKGKIDGKFNIDERNLPSPLDLTLKLGARVMFTANDRNIPRRWMNGSLGKVIQFESDAITVELDVGISQNSRTRHLVEVPIYSWESYQYEFDEKESQIKPVVNGKFEQFPLMLAWAVTIHKSQGKTLEKVRVDLSGGTFAPGQVYVSLSRCTTLEGIELQQPIRTSDIRTDSKVKDFYKKLN